MSVRGQEQRLYRSERPKEPHDRLPNEITNFGCELRVMISRNREERRQQNALKAAHPFDPILKKETKGNPQNWPLGNVIRFKSCTDRTNSTYLRISLRLPRKIIRLLLAIGAKSLCYLRDRYYTNTKNILTFVKKTA